MIILIKTDITAIGYFVLFVSVVTGVYGVMLAIVQHNLKKLLAYHSIENIGIIGIGIGLGCLGIGYSNQMLVIAGFGGALLHILNHSLFKSLLFYTAGIVYQAKHTMNIESLGGLIKHMPRTAYLFLLGSLAICGLPPFNGFVSEFFIYNGLFKGLLSNSLIFILFILFTILGLVLIGGLALICFTKAFGIVFLGSPREKEQDVPVTENRNKIQPLYLIAVAIILIGLFPFVFKSGVLKIISLFQPELDANSFLRTGNLFDNLTVIGWYSLGFIGISALIYFIRYSVTRTRQKTQDITWGCGYTGETSEMQYTASSFIRTYRKLAEPVLFIKKEKTDASGLYPQKAKQETHPYDKLEKWLIDKPVGFIMRFLNRFVFLQNGRIQAYILYGFIFVALTVLLPVILDKIEIIVKFLNQL